jgi:hypothetical protein
MPGVRERDSFSITGTRKARVLPVPVWAVARTSRPARAGGIAAAWTGVGIVMLAEARFPCKTGERDSSKKVFIQELRTDQVGLQTAGQRIASTSVYFSIARFRLTRLKRIVQYKMILKMEPAGQACYSG